MSSHRSSGVDEIALRTITPTTTNTTRIRIPPKTRSQIIRTSGYWTHIWSKRTTPIGVSW